MKKKPKVSTLLSGTAQSSNVSPANSPVEGTTAASGDGQEETGNPRPILHQLETVADGGEFMLAAFDSELETSASGTWTPISESLMDFGLTTTLRKIILTLVYLGTDADFEPDAFKGYVMTYKGRQDPDYEDGCWFAEHQIDHQMSLLVPKARVAEIRGAVGLSNEGQETCRQQCGREINDAYEASTALTGSDSDMLLENMRLKTRAASRMCRLIVDYTKVPSTTALEDAISNRSI